MTALSWPIRWSRSSAWSWRAGVQSSSRNATFDARVSVMPCDAAFSEQTISCGPSSSWNASTARWRASAVSLPRMWSASGKRSSTACCVAMCSANTTSGSPDSRKSAIHASAVGELAARGELAQVVEPHELLGAQRGGDLRVDRAQVERQRLEPGDHVALREPVLVLVRRAAPGTVSWRLAGSCGQHLLLGPPDVAVGAQVPVQAVVAAGGAEPAREPGAAAEVLQAAEHAQLRHQLLGAVQDRRAGERQPQGVVGQLLAPARARPSCAARAGSSRSATRRGRARAARARRGARRASRGCRS